MKQKLANWRWRIVGLAIAIIAIRAVVSITFSVTVAGDAAPKSGFQAFVTALDTLCLVLVVVAIAAFVWYGRIYRARVPTE